MIQTYVLDCSQLPDPLEQAACLSGLPGERVEKIKRQKQPEVRRQSLGAGLLLEFGLHQWEKACEAAPDRLQEMQGTVEKALSVPLQYGPYGKPYYPKGPGFSLSHSGKYVILSMEAYPLQAKGPALVGCDIEKIKTCRKGVARRFFTKREQEMLEHIQEQARQDETFCQFWTRKESILKLTGLGLALPMDTFDVSFGKQAEPVVKKIMEWSSQTALMEKPAECKRKGQKQLDEAGQGQEADRQKQLQRQQAAKLLQNVPLYLQEYRLEDYCICVCSDKNQFAQELEKPEDLYH